MKKEKEGCFQMKNCKKVSAIVLFLVLAITSILVALPAINAHDPAITIPTWVFASVAPNPTSLNQSTTLIFWNSVAPPEAESSPDVRWTFGVSLKDPDGTVLSLGDFISEADGRASTIFKLNMTGEWSVTVNFPETVYLWNATPAQAVWTGDIFSASSYTATFTVQGEPVPEPLPIDYYKSGDWFKVTSNYLGSSSPQVSGERYAQRWDDSAGSLTSHVMWTKPIEAGGLAGGTNVGVPGDSFYQGLAYNMRFRSTQTFILDGKLYYREPLGESGQVTDYIIVDLRSGEEIARTDVTSLGMGYSCNGVTFFSSTNFDNWLDPNTLEPLGTSLTDVPSGTSVIGSLGEILKIGIDNDDGDYYVYQWNSSKVIVPGLSGDVPADGPNAYDFRDVPITYRGAPYDIPDTNIFGAVANEYLVTVSSTSSPFTGNRTFWMISLKSENRGKIVATHTIDKDQSPFSQIEENLLWTSAVWDREAHVIPFWSKNTVQWMGFNFETGEVWGPTPPESPWSYYGSPTIVSYNTDYHASNGRLLSVGWAGILYCYDITDGSLMFTYGLAGNTVNANITSSGFQTTYGVYPSFAGAVTPVNGRVYVFVNEHSPNTPHMKGTYMRCIDIINQREDWILSNYGGARPATPSEGTTLIVGNDFTLNLNNHDQQIYALARGPSATTVETTTSSMVEGHKIILKGTVLDMSAGTLQHEQAARFPNGVACASDDDMTQWMEYVYINRPRPDVTGVDVTLTIVDADGVVQDTEVVTSDSTGYYSYMWEPSADGVFTVTADFAGTNGYYPSVAQTSFTVEAAPEPTPTPEPTPAPMTNTYILGATIAIIAVIFVITAVVAIFLRRK
jgi:hypothetical protein